MNFWEWLVQSGLISGDPNYYSSGQASPDEMKHAVRTAIGGLATASDPNAAQDFYTRLQQASGFGGDAGYYARGEAGAAEIENLINVAGDSLKAAPAATVGAPQAPSAPHPLEPGAPAAPVVGTPTGVLGGGSTVRTRQPDGTYRWFQVYQLPPGSGQYVAYQYNDVQQVEAALGPTPGFTDWSPAQLTQFTQGAVGAAEEVIGMAGDWNTFSQEIMQQAAARAGISDPTLIGKMWSDPQMQQIAGRAIVGDWTPEQILAEQRKTTFWTETLYPGIQAFYGRTTEPERAWNNYAADVSPALTALGYQKDANGSYSDQIKTMLDGGIDAQVFLENAPIFAQAVQNQAFFEVLRTRSQAELGKDLTFGDWFSLLKGEAATEIQQVAEGAVVAYQAQQANVGIDESMLQRLINERDLSETEARNLFSEVNQAVLALGEPGLKRGNLTRDDVISAMAGIEATTGLSPDDVKLRVAKIARENDLFDEEKINFYVGYDTAGRPNRPGLQSLAPEGA